MSGDATPLHRSFVERVLQDDPQAKTGRFRKTVAKALGDPEAEDLREIPQIIPDAYSIAREDDSVIVTAYEVEVSSRLNDRRLRSYAQWWWFLDYLGHDLRLIVVDRFARIGPWTWVHSRWQMPPSSRYDLKNCSCARRRRDASHRTRQRDGAAGRVHGPQGSVHVQRLVPGA
jgi:hypothetical protein